MIKYNLKCSNKHEFESWFADSKEFDKLNKRKMLECIFCHSKKIEKSIMSPRVGTHGKNKFKSNFQGNHKFIPLKPKWQIKSKVIYKINQLNNEMILILKMIISLKLIKLVL